MKDFKLESDGEAIGVTLGDDLTAAVVPGLKDALRNATAEGMRKVEFDLGNTAVIDSTGIGLLIATFNSLSRVGGTITVVNVSDDIFRLLQNMRLEKRLSVSKR